MTERDLFANFQRMRRDMEEMLGDVRGRGGFSRRRLAFVPAVDVAYTADPPRAIVTAELAGIDAERLELEIQGRKLVLSGRRESPAREGDVYQQVEIERGSFRRVIELGAEVVAEKASARYEDGMLRVELPLARGDASARSVPIDRAQAASS
ncbi:MAG: Hsp20/alpha crystallin family protein [Solirubrobacterales bacterium]|nr:Hsp20/alpha crystallin family protein [Solirubrobacterales bacterium]